MNTFNKAGHINEEAVSLYVDALMLNTIDIIPEQVLVHVENCARCKKEIIEVIDIMKEAKAHAEEKPEDKDKSGSDIKINKSLLMILMLSVIGYIFINLNTFRHENPVVSNDNHQIIGISNEVIEMVYTNDEEVAILPEKPAMPAKTANSKKVKSQNFNISYNLESLVETNFRSKTVRVIEPKIAHKYSEGDPISFNFNNTMGKTLFIKILNNKEENVFATDFRGNNYVLRQKLPPGLYYWKLETEDDLLYMGKFIVK